MEAGPGHPTTAGNGERRLKQKDRKIKLILKKSKCQKWNRKHFNIIVHMLVQMGQKDKLQLHREHYRKKALAFHL